MVRIRGNSDSENKKQLFKIKLTCAKLTLREKMSLRAYLTPTRKIQ